MHPKIRRDLARQLVTCTGGHGAGRGLAGDDGAKAIRDRRWLQMLRLEPCEHLVLAGLAPQMSFRGGIERSPI